MAREGIYVGGKEIIQRYVGNKLVWEKFKLLVTNNFGGWSKIDVDTVRQIILPNESRSYDESTLKVITSIKIGGKIIYPKKVTIETDFSSNNIYSTTSNLFEQIVFKNEYDTNLFISLVQRGENVYYGRKGN